MLHSSWANSSSTTRKAFVISWCDDSVPIAWDTAFQRDRLLDALPRLHAGIARCRPGREHIVCQPDQFRHRVSLYEPRWENTFLPGKTAHAADAPPPRLPQLSKPAATVKTAGTVGVQITGAELRQRFRNAAGDRVAAAAEPRVLSDEELESFRVEGYLEGLMDKDLCQRAVDGVFECARGTGLRLDQSDPTTWANPFRPEDEDEENEGSYRTAGIGHRWHLREVGGEDLLCDLLPRRCYAIAQQLIGHSVIFPSGGEPTVQRTAALQSREFRQSKL